MFEFVWIILEFGGWANFKGRLVDKLCCFRIRFGFRIRISVRIGGRINTLLANKREVLDTRQNLANICANKGMRVGVYLNMVFQRLEHCVSAQIVLFLRLDVMEEFHDLLVHPQPQVRDLERGLDPGGDFLVVLDLLVLGGQISVLFFV